MSKHELVGECLFIYKDKEDVLACGSYMGMELFYKMLWKICKESLKVEIEEMWNWQHAVRIYGREVVWQMLFLYFVNCRKNTWQRRKTILVDDLCWFGESDSKWCLRRWFNWCSLRYMGVDEWIVLVKKQCIRMQWGWRERERERERGKGFQFQSGVASGLCPQPAAFRLSARDVV